MAKNPKPKRPNRNTLYIARSGGGKSQALRQSAEIPVQGARVILWDNAHDQSKNTTYFSNIRDFGRALARCDAQSAGFRIAYDGERTELAFEWFCRLCWSVLDGRKLTYVIVEELGRPCRTASRAMPWHERLVSEGRKYGLCYHASNQRTQEIPKTISGNCEVLWIGPQEPHDAKVSADLVGVSRADLLTLEPLQFYVRDYAKHPHPKKISLNFRA